MAEQRQQRMCRNQAWDTGTVGTKGGVGKWGGTGGDARRTRQSCLKGALSPRLSRWQ